MIKYWYSKINNQFGAFLYPFLIKKTEIFKSIFELNSLKYWLIVN
jgi:hypothetical protein